MPNIHPHDVDWVNKKLHGLPSIHKNVIQYRYKQFGNRRDANLHLLRTTSAISKVLGHNSSRMSCVSVDDRDFKAMSTNHARQCIKIASRMNSQSLFKTYSAIVRYVTCNQIKPHPVLVKPNWTLLVENFQTLPVTDHH
ncbi:hypothetical protein GCM10009411_12420 [Shewanella litoralis]|uniref:Uncharacterized protein n=1 Tax=Shewanella litoralis TaxID=2282700 RepID=A0ABQ2R840_9GAMM|nr:hypothetical protein GCM10009411_12420 [Shewanella litoralis]